MTGFDQPERYDLVTTFDAVHDQKDPQALIASLHAALRPGGIYLMQDIAGSARLENNLDFPMAAFLYTISCLHCMPVSLGQGRRGAGHHVGLGDRRGDAQGGRVRRTRAPTSCPTIR